MQQPPPVGRFAPSPTGPLHFGSLVAAVASFLEARSAGGRWLVRMEDVDAPRTVPGSDREILRALAALGLEWDGPVLYQSGRGAAYAEAMEGLLARGHAFPCACSRRSAGPGPYPGTCRGGLPPGRRPRSVRALTAGATEAVTDRIQGGFAQDLEQAVGDFVIRRADGLFAYQLAVVVDDAEQGVTQVVRGADLLDSTPRQQLLLRRLGLAIPEYAHVPVATDATGRKLAKSSGAPAVDPARPGATLGAALRFLGHPPPKELDAAPARAVLDWALGAWRLQQVPRVTARPAPPPPHAP
jgi:glutamyl-Q tRNA(Asp) synthetase